MHLAVGRGDDCEYRQDFEEQLPGAGAVDAGGHHGDEEVYFLVRE